MRELRYENLDVERRGQHDTHDERYAQLRCFLLYLYQLTLPIRDSLICALRASEASHGRRNHPLARQYHCTLHKQRGQHFSSGFGGDAAANDGPSHLGRLC